MPSVRHLSWFRINMKSKDYFTLAVRIIGFLTLAHGFRDLVDYGLILLGYTSTHSAFSYYLILGLLYSVVGLYLLRGAPLVVNFAYPRREREAPEDDLDE
jgi:hypothetical protein